MNIYNTVPYFINYYEPTEEFLKTYQKTFAPHFREYFLYHCKNPDDKIKVAHQRYNLNNISEISKNIEKYIQEIAKSYQKKYNVQFEKDVHIIVGMFGSNAFCQREIIPEVTFCVEKLSPNAEHLKVIIAHEFGHVLHRIFSYQERMDWYSVQWYHPYTMLLEEGCATYFSKQVSKAKTSVYFSYDENGDEWLNFAINNFKLILNAFLEDLEKYSHEHIYYEWFSISGGKRFGYTRLAYYIGYRAVKKLIEKYGELKGITIWRNPSFFDQMKEILVELKNS
jgi:hypothetical protein